jgi:hypothetical protein
MSLIDFNSYLEKEIEQSYRFANSLEIEKVNCDIIDNWLESWMELNKKIDIGNEQTDEFKIVYNSLEKILCNLDGNTFKYLLGRTIKTYDLMWGGLFSSVTNASNMKIKHYIDEILPSNSLFQPNEFLSFLEYLEGTSISPNSDIFDYIWKIEKSSRFFINADFQKRNKALKYLLELNALRGFHHNIKDFKKIIAVIKQDNIDIIIYLNNYKVVNNQGCFQAINYILRDVKNFNTFELKKDCINWLDNAVGRYPKKSWLDKMTTIQRKLSEEELIKIINWILSNNVEREQSTGWIDDVYKRFQKSSTWYLEFK